MNEKLSDKMLQFGMWLGKPERLREPKRLEEFGELIGVTRQTLSRWKKDPAVIDIAQNYKKLEAQVHLDDVIKVMTDRAMLGNAADRRLYLEWLGELDKSKKDKDTAIGVIEVRHTVRSSEA